MIETITYQILIFGLVQGVGFRPFFARLARECGLTGVVRNDGGIVWAAVNGTKGQIDRLLFRLKAESPPGSAIDRIETTEIPRREFDGFLIDRSGANAQETPVIPPDLPLCDACKKELYDPLDRRYRNPFISCVACGPRYSIIESLPYDRCRTTMDAYAMCGPCEEEYLAGGRRDFAQTISCNDCGPVLLLAAGGKTAVGEAALKDAVAILQAGGVLAIKGIGGYHFVCSPFDKTAVEKLRALKKRDKKPFAVQFKTVEEIRAYCTVSPEEEELLLSTSRPIVLLPFENTKIDAGVCGDSQYLGAFLPYTPLQELLLDECGPLVMTSANVTDQPLLTEDGDVLALEAENLDGVLYNTRRILRPLDDSVARVAAGMTQWIRRSRGAVPLPLHMKGITGSAEPVYAAGGDLKASFCLLNGDRAYMSQYFGDMKNPDVAAVYLQNYKQMTQLFGIRPRYIACDMHPDYESTRIAKQTGLEAFAVQHHHAHIASVIVEHGIEGPAIGVAFDGTGYGTDGAVWGGEFLLCEGSGYRRAGHLSYVSLLGGDNASRDAALCADAYLIAAGLDEMSAEERRSLMKAALKKSIGVHQSSSMGRLFDAVSAITGQKKYNSFEGECAIALENLAIRAMRDGEIPYPLYFSLEERNSEFVADQTRLAGEIAAAIKSGVDAGAIAAGFHRAIVKLVTDTCERLRDVYFIHTVALSGGVFANRLLIEDCVDGLQRMGFDVFANCAVPMNDGGIALGQAAIAARKLFERKSF